MQEQRLREYAQLIAKVGLNVQSGQDCVVECELDQPNFIKILVEEIYKLGARRVFVDWDMQDVAKLHYDYCSLETLSSLEKWELEKWDWKATKLPAMCYIISEDPSGLSEIDQDKFAKSKAEKYKFIKQYRDRMEAKYQWCIAAVPGVNWAKRVFSNVDESEAVEKLWNAILSASRVDGNAISNWQEHNAILKKRYDFLNAQNFSSLHYYSKVGTDFTVGLIDEGRFTGGMEKTLSGITFNPNIPSEEIFTSPKAGVCEGILFSSKPLSYDGQLIENFSIKFADGKVVEVKAEKNQSLLEKIVKMDNGASMLGECALVGFDSPINNTKILFFETLFDENACCHFALGKGFSECLENFDKMTLKERRQKGINESMIHVDFMIGTKDLNIDGIKKDGSTVAIFKDGDWVI